MKKWVLGAFGVSAPLLGIGAEIFRYIYSRWPLSPLEWVGVAYLAASTICAIAWVVYFFREYLALKRWVSPSTVQDERVREWLRTKTPAGFPAMVTRSLDDRIYVMLCWWDERPRAT